MEKEFIIPSGICGNGIGGNGIDSLSGSFELDEKEFEMLSKELSI